MPNENDGWGSGYPEDHEEDSSGPEVDSLSPETANRKAAEAMAKQEKAFDRARRLPGRRLKAAVVLKARGFTYEEIAEMQDFASTEDARMAVEAGIAASGVGTESVEQLRKEADLQLDMFMTLCMERTFPERGNGSAGYAEEQGQWMDRGLRVLDRKLRLHGVDAPVTMKISADSIELERYAQIVAIANGASQATEADPFEMGEIEAQVVDGSE